MSAGPETMLKPPLSLFSHPQQTFQCMDSLHQLGPPPMAPAQPLGPPPLASAQGIGPPTVVATRTLAPPPINASHTLRPPPITPSHSLGPPPMAPAQPLRLPPMAHALGPAVPPNMDLTPPLGLPPLNPAHALVPPPVVTPGNGQLPLPPSPLSSPPAPSPEASQVPQRLPPPAIIPAPVSCLISGALLGQGPLASEQPQEDDPPLGAEEQEDSLGLGELCKPLYCKLCNVTLNSAQQAQAHYQVRRCILPTWNIKMQIYISSSLSVFLGKKSQQKAQKFLCWQSAASSHQNPWGAWGGRPDGTKLRIQWRWRGKAG